MTRAGDVHAEARDVVAAVLDLGDVDTDAHFEVLGHERTPDLLARPEGGARRREHREHAVAGRLHDATAAAADHRACDRVVVVQHRLPPLVTDRRRALGRRHEVGEQHRAQRAARRGNVRLAGEEAGDLGDERVDVGPDREVVGTREVDELRVRDRVGNPGHHPGRPCQESRAAQHQGRHAHTAVVDRVRAELREVRLDHALGGPRARTELARAVEPGEEVRILHPCRERQRQQLVALAGGDAAHGLPELVVPLVARGARRRDGAEEDELVERVGKADREAARDAEHVPGEDHRLREPGRVDDGREVVAPLVDQRALPVDDRVGEADAAPVEDRRGGRWR